MTFMPVIKNSVYIEAPVDKVLLYKNDPANMIQYRANASDYQNISGTGEVGTSCDLKLLMLGMYIPMKLEVIEDSKTADGGSTKYKMSDLKAGVVYYETDLCQRKDNGTEVTIEFEYTIQNNSVAKIADKLIVEKLMTVTIAHSLDNLKIICEAKDLGSWAFKELIKGI